MSVLSAEREHLSRVSDQPLECLQTRPSVSEFLSASVTRIGTTDFRLLRSSGGLFSFFLLFCPSFRLVLSLSLASLSFLQTQSAAPGAEVFEKRAERGHRPKYRYPLSFFEAITKRRRPKNRASSLSGNPTKLANGYLATWLILCHH